MTSCRRLVGRIAVITGSTSGIGLAIAKRFGQEGAKVIVSSRKEEHVKKTVEILCAEKIEVKGVVCHIAKSKERQHLLETAREWGGLDILVSNVALSPVICEIFDTEEGAWDKIFEVTLKANFLLSKEAIPLLRTSKYGRIIYGSSIAAYAPLDFAGAYSVAKTAMLGLTKAASQQTALDGITVNAVAPGVIRTKFSGVITTDETEQQEFMEKIPMARMGTVGDVAGVYAFLASDDAQYITGETIIVSGGMSSRL